MKSALAPQPGQTPVMGSDIAFYSATAPNVSPKDQCMIEGTGQPTNQWISICWPWDRTSAPVVGQVDGSGNLIVFATVPASYTGSIAGPDGYGLVFRAASDPSYLTHGLFVVSSERMVPAAAPPPPLSPGLPNLLAALTLSYQTHVKIADWRTDLDKTVMVTSYPPWATGAEVGPLIGVLALTDSASQAVATLLGGSVVKLQLPQSVDPFAKVGNTNILPSVNYIQAVLDSGGPLMQANAAQLVQAFDVQAPNTESAIRATFKTV